jgi:hypothetical protein
LTFNLGSCYDVRANTQNQKQGEQTMLYNNMWLHQELVNVANQILSLDEAEAIEAVLDLAYSIEHLSQLPQEDAIIEEVAGDVDYVAM